SSSQLLDAIDWAFAQNKDENSPYSDKIDTTNISVSGMSCGGLQALKVAPDPRISTVGVFNSGIFNEPMSGNPMVPEVGKDQLEKLHSPALYLIGGESDIAYENGMDDFSRINHVPVFVGNMDVGHGGTYREPHGGAFAEVATQWFKWQLKNDDKAGKWFKGSTCGLCQSDVWEVDKKNIP
ncbi:hypothetical protein QLX67_11290, partial [Balneolaceae bacterium ANBcel3]|nr:hypothetical protein [Balneolaceae bacterium ANBcel3]